MKKANSKLTVAVEPNKAIISRFHGNYDASIQKLINLSSVKSFLSEIYSVDITLSGYCSGYSYTKANQVADPCKSFGEEYLPSSSFFDELMSDLDETTEQDKLHEALMNFAQEISSDPRYYGYSRDASSSTKKTISLEFKPSVQNINGTLINVDTDTSQMLEDGRVQFQLTPSSNFLKHSTTPFSIAYANPVVTNVRAYWTGVHVKDGETMQLLETQIQSNGPYAIYDAEGKKHKYSLPEFRDDNTGVAYFSKTNSIETKPENSCDVSCNLCSCGTDRNSKRVEWADGSSTCFCTDETEGNALDGLPDVFTFPTLWSSWTVQANNDDWTNPYSEKFDKNYTQLTLQVAFEFISTTDLIGSPQGCHNKCHDLHTAMTINFGWDEDSVLIGHDWCQEDVMSMSSTISNCLNDLPIIGDDDPPINGGFCRCNMGTNTAEISSADLTKTYSFTTEWKIEVQTNDISARRQLRGNKQKRIKKAMATATATKSGKGGTTNNGSKSGKSNSQIGVGTYDQNDGGGNDDDDRRRGLLGNQTHQSKVYGDMVMKTVEANDDSEGYILTIYFDLQFPHAATEDRDAYKFWVTIKDTSSCPENLADLDSFDDLTDFTGNNEEVWNHVVNSIDDNGRASGTISVSYMQPIDFLFNNTIALVNRNDEAYMHCTVFREIKYAVPQTTTEEIELDVFRNLDFTACANETLSVLHTFLTCYIDEVEGNTNCTVSFNMEQNNDGERNSTSTSVVSSYEFDSCIKEIITYPGFARILAELMGGCAVHVSDEDGNESIMAWEQCPDSNDDDELFE